MKLITKKDIWGIIFASGIGVVTFLTYKIGKTEGMIQANEETINMLDTLIKEAENKEINVRIF